MDYTITSLFSVYSYMHYFGSSWYIMVMYLMLSKCSLMLAVTRLLNAPVVSLTVIVSLPIRGQAAAGQSGVP